MRNTAAIDLCAGMVHSSHSNEQYLTITSAQKSCACLSTIMSDSINKLVLPFEQHHAYVIGIDNYQYTNKLKTAVGDAEAVAAKLRAQGFDRLTLIKEEQATRERIEQLLQDDIRLAVGKEDRLILYFAGHGIAFDSELDPKGFLVPVDGNLDDQDSLLAMETLKQAMDQWQCRHGLLILDCCFAGAFRWELETRVGRRRKETKIVYEERFLRYAQDPAWQVLTSSSSDEEALDVLHKLLGSRPEVGHSPFAQALLEGLDGAADFIMADGKQDGVITATELYVHLRDQVQKMTAGQAIKQTPAIFDLRKHRKGEFMFLNHRAAVNRLPTLDVSFNPYKGLSSFDEADAPYFFGREDAIEELYSLLSERNLVVVTGGSGSGKSSLVKAGLLPRLRMEGWNILPIVRSGHAPLRNLGLMIPDLEAQLKVGQHILVLDQYEEALLGGLDATAWLEFEAYVSKLLSQIERSSGAVKLKFILTIRSDYEILLQGYDHPLKARWQKGRCWIPAPTEDDLYDMIVKPAAQAVLYFREDDLPHRILGEVSRAPGVLPLLSFSMHSLFKRYRQRDVEGSRELTEADYDALGGIAGALSKRAEEVYGSLSIDQQRIMKHLMLRMLKIEHGELIRRKVAILLEDQTAREAPDGPLFNELDFVLEEGTDVQIVIDHLLEAQLIISPLPDSETGQAFLEPAHDALINYWPQCLRWVKEAGPEKLIIYRQLWKSVTDYFRDQKNQDPITKATLSSEPTSFLWHSNPHLEALKRQAELPHSGLNRAENDFIQASWKARQDWIQRLEQQLREAQAGAMVAQALFLYQTNNTKAYNLARHAFELADTPDTRSALLEIGSNPKALFYKRTPAHDGEVKALAFGSDGQFFVTGGEDGVVKRWDRQGNWIQTYIYKDANANLGGVRSLDIAPDGEAIVAGFASGAIVVWETEGKVLSYITDFQEPIAVVAFIPSIPASPPITADRWQIIAGPVGRQERVVVWNLDGSLAKEIEIPQAGKLLSVTNTLMGTYLLFRVGNIMLSVFTLDGEPIPGWHRKNVAHQEAIRSATISNDGQFILTGGVLGDATIWRANGEKFLSFDNHEKAVSAVVFSPLGKYMLTASTDGTAILRSFENFEPLVLAGEGPGINTVAFSPDYRLLAFGCTCGAFLLHDLQGALHSVFKHKDHHSARYSTLLVHPVKDQIFYCQADMSGILINFKGGLQFPGNASQDEILQAWGPVEAAAFSKSGKYLLTFNARTAKRWDLENGTFVSFTSQFRPIFVAAVRSDGSVFLVERGSPMISYYDKEQGSPKKLTGHTDPVTSLALSQDEQFLISGSYTKTRLWNLADHTSAVLTKHTQTVQTIEISPDGQGLLLLTSEGVSLYHLDLTKAKARLKFVYGEDQRNTPYPYFTIDFSADSRFYLLTDGRAGRAYLYDMDGRKLQEFRGDLIDAEIGAARFSSDGLWVIASILSKNNGQQISLWRNNWVHWEKNLIEHLNKEDKAKYGIVDQEVPASPKVESEQ